MAQIAFEQEATRRESVDGAVAPLLLQDDVAAPDDDRGEVAIVRLRGATRAAPSACPGPCRRGGGWNPGRRACASRPWIRAAGSTSRPTGRGRSTAARSAPSASRRRRGRPSRRRSVNGKCWLIFSAIKPHEAPFATHSSAARAPASPTFWSSLQTIGFPNCLSAAIRAGISSSGVPLKWIRRKSAASARPVGIAAVAQAAGGDEQAGRPSPSPAGSARPRPPRCGSARWSKPSWSNSLAISSTTLR